jgi:hypothetical protein
VCGGGGGLLEKRWCSDRMPSAGALNVCNHQSFPSSCSSDIQPLSVILLLSVLLSVCPAVVFLPHTQITQQVDEQAEGPPLTLTAVSGQSISLTTDMLKVGGCAEWLFVGLGAGGMRRVPWGVLWLAWLGGRGWKGGQQQGRYR